MINTSQSAIKLVATDLDGTLLKDDKSISQTDIETLVRIGQKKVVRVAATGRSLHKVNDVLPASTPIDFVVFSSGAGIFDWETKRIIHAEKFEPEVAYAIGRHLLESNFNFYIFRPIPHNNLFWYHKGAGECVEFDNYLNRHEGDFGTFDIERFEGEVGQVMAVIPNHDSLINKLTAEIYKACNKVRVIRTTSPVNAQYTWLEIFPETVSKGHGLEWLCQYLDIDPKLTAGIGNDYNDLDMFEFVEYPFLLKNGAVQLKEVVRTIDYSNQQNGLSRAVEMLDI